MMLRDAATLSFPRSDSKIEVEATSAIIGGAGKPKAPHIRTALIK